MFDVIIKGGRIIDGTGNPWFYGDVGVCGDRVDFIGKINSKSARYVINAFGKVVCPGFIDMHSHSDVMIFANPEHEPKIMQGVTTDMLGLDGLSYAPLSTNNLKMMRRYLSGLNGNPNISWNWNSVSQYLSQLDRKIAINVAFLVPHNALRLQTIGFLNRLATNEELKEMQKIVSLAMDEGAVGFSTGLDYCPGRYSNTKELIEICKTVSDYNGLSVWHVRKRDLGLLEAIKEVIEVANRTNVKAHISHYHASGANRGKSDVMLKLIDEAREEGVDITFDSYPYTAGSTTMISLLPPWVHEGGPEAILERLSDPKTKSKICNEFFENDKDYTCSDEWERRIIAGVSMNKNKKYVGKSISESARIAGKNIPEFYCDLLLEEKLSASMISARGSEEDMREIMKHPCHTSCSDGLLVGDKPHPRAWGAFARFLGFYCRELGILNLEEMVRHMTSAPAQRIGLNDRGLIKEGFAADIVVFDPKEIKDMATFEQPRKYPKGIYYVLVNGAVVIDNCKHTGLLNGRALRQNGPC